MTTRLVLPSDRSWVQMTDGTNNAFITGVSGDVELYIGDTAPDENSAVHPLGNEIVIRTPITSYIRATGVAAGRAEVSYSQW